jgi:hypothetical protein
LTINLENKIDRNGGDYIFAKTNLDSEEVRGQGKYLWNFLISQLNHFSLYGYEKMDPNPLLHEVSPNKYSKKLVTSSLGYKRKGRKYFKLY